MKIQPFEKFTSEYEDWFERNKFAFISELNAVKNQLPDSTNGVEIGVGSGRFAAPLSIKLGIEPSKEMRKIARKRGIEIIAGVAEHLPLVDFRFDFALMITTICFVDDLETSFGEAYRVLKKGGFLIVGFVDKESIVGKLYREHKEESLFYKIANFYSVNEVVSNLKKAEFENFDFTQTIFHSLKDVKEVEPVKEGYGEGAFVVIKALK